MLVFEEDAPHLPSRAPSSSPCDLLKSFLIIIVADFQFLVRLKTTYLDFYSADDRTSTVPVDFPQK